MKDRVVRIGISIIGFLWLAVLATPVFASTTMTLREAVARALTGNDRIRAAGYGAEVAREGVRDAQSRLLPKISFEERFLHSDTPAFVFATAINQGRFSAGDLAAAPGSFNNPEAVGDFQTTLSLEQAIYSRRAFSGLELARGEAEAVELDLLRKKEETAFQVYRAFVGALTAEAYLDTAQSGLENAREHFRIAETMERAGVGLTSDRLRAEVALGQAEMNLLRIKHDLEIARRGLGLVLGTEEPVTPVADASVTEEPPVEELLQTVENRLDIRAMNRRLRNADRNIGLAEGEFLPEIGFVGALQANDRETPIGMEGTSYRVGAALQWNFFSGFGSSARRAKARLERARAERMLEGMKKKARFDLVEASLRLREARASEEISRRALEAAKESTRLVRVRYENGLSAMVTLLDAQTALNQARADVVRSRMKKKLARGELKYRAGTLLRELAPEAVGTAEIEGRAGEPVLHEKPGANP